MEDKKELTLSAPWINFWHELEKLFEYDDQVTVKYDNDSYEVMIFVTSQEKAEALATILPQERVFGNITLKVTVIPANVESTSMIDTFRKAFLGNPIVADIATVPSIFGSTSDYVVFVPEVVQYFNDDISDINRVRTTLYQEIAKDVFENAGIFFCTDIVSEDYE